MKCPKTEPIEGKAKDFEEKPSLTVKCPKCGHEFNALDHKNEGL